MPPGSRSFQPSVSAHLRRRRGAACAVLLLLALGALATTGAVPWSAAASDAPVFPAMQPPVAGSAATAPPTPAGPGEEPRLAASPGLEDGAAATGERRAPRQLAAVLERKLKALREAKERGDASGARAIRDDLLNERRLASEELKDQLGRGSTPVYWALTILREALEQDDDIAIERALRYLRGALARER